MFNAYFCINEKYIFACGVVHGRKKYKCGEQLLPGVSSCQATVLLSPCSHVNNTDFEAHMIYFTQVEQQ